MSSASSNRRQGRNLTSVKMPTGSRAVVTFPAMPCNHLHCSYKVRLKLLGKGGNMGRREHKIVADEMVSTIKSHVLQEYGGGRFSTYEIVSVHKVKNDCLWKRYRQKKSELAQEAGKANERMLFHGSTAADEIVKNGFDKNRAKPSGMFGTGIYFAEHSSKSNQYAYGLLGGNGCPAHKNKNCYTCPRKMLLCRVSLGQMYKLKNAIPMDSLPSGYHSVFGEPTTDGLRYPEYAVYSEDQIYPEYLITYRIVP